MAEITIKKWQCDMCHEIYDKQPKVPFPRYVIRLTEIHDVGGNESLWVDLCVGCNQVVGKAILNLLRDAELERGETVANLTKK